MIRTGQTIVIAKGFLTLEFVKVTILVQRSIIVLS